MKNIIFLIILCLLIGCKNRFQPKEKTTECPALPEINLKEKYPTKKIVLQEVADIEYIPLETKAHVLVSSFDFFKKAAMSDSLIVTYHYKDGMIYVFNREGKNLYAFTHMGRGSEEYIRIIDMAVDFGKREIYILDLWSNWRILIYSLDGTFKRVLKIPEWYKIFQLYNYDKNTLLCYEGFHLEDFDEEGYRHQPYALISKKDGKIMPLDLTLSERVASFMHPDDKPNERIYFEIYPLIKCGDRFLISDFACDTIYSLRGTILTPYLLKSPPSLWKERIPKLVRVKLATENYTLLEEIEKKLSNYLDRHYKLSITHFFYNHVTGEVVKPLFINADAPEKIITINYSQCDFPANYTCLSLSAIQLLQEYAAGKLRGKLKEIASRLNEDDNPVLMLIKFKE